MQSIRTVMAGNEPICQQNLSLSPFPSKVKKGTALELNSFSNIMIYENISAKKNLISKGLSSTLVHPEKWYCYIS
jgi:hypothetical protein